ncbi:MAG: 4Fe-4S dicluster domain-containing protein [Candidatus Nezhaarchaeales archaeon]
MVISHKIEEFRKALLEFAKRGTIASEAVIEVPELLYGFGKPIYDSEKCYGCAACTIQCLGGALRLIETQDRRRIYMDYWRCIACEECAIKCPKEAVKVERVFDLSSFLSDEPLLLIDVELKRCMICGRSISSIKQINEVHDLIKHLPLPKTHIDRIGLLCENCKKVVAAKSLLRSRGAKIG